MSGNKLTCIDVEGNINLESLAASNNKVERKPKLPSLLKELELDKEVVIDFDFSCLPCLKKLSIANGLMNPA